MKLLFVIDMQNDFIYGVLGNPEALMIVPKVVEKIKNADNVIFTYDTHDKNYLQTEEGKHLPIPHCIKGTEGWQLSPIFDTINKGIENMFFFKKETFGYPWNIYEDFKYEDFNPKNVTEIEIVGLDTDFCVLANAMTLKAAFPNVPITIDAACCAGSTPEWHEKALDMLEHCHFNVINRKKE